MTNSGDSERYNKPRNTSLGCHTVGRKGFMNFLEVHEYFGTHGVPVGDVEFQYEWQTEFGFRDTKVYQEFGDPRTWNENWHTMGWDGCRGNGSSPVGDPYEHLPRTWVKTRQSETWTY
jgi:hypothetical protein